MSDRNSTFSGMLDSKCNLSRLIPSFINDVVPDQRSVD